MHEDVTAPISDADVLIRPAYPEDLSATNNLRWAAGWADPPSAHLEWPEPDESWVAGNHFREYVAEVDGIVAGRIGMEAYCPPFAELIDLCVRPDYRRRGIGEALMRGCIREAARRGFAFLTLQTEVDNVASHGLYHRLGFVPTAHTRMLRMLRPVDYPLVTEFERTHPLCQYSCSQVPEAQSAWTLRWNGYVLNDFVELRFEGAAAQSDSDRIGPALPCASWQEAGRRCSVTMGGEEFASLRPGDHFELTIDVENAGPATESGVIRMCLPAGVSVASPAYGVESSLAWEAAPGEKFSQPLVLRLEPSFDPAPLWYLNYQTLPISAEVWWKDRRALVSVSVPATIPPAPGS